MWELKFGGGEAACGVVRFRVDVTFIRAMPDCGKESSICGRDMRDEERARERESLKAVWVYVSVITLFCHSVSIASRSSEHLGENGSSVRLGSVKNRASQSADLYTEKSRPGKIFLKKKKKKKTL